MTGRGVFAQADVGGNHDRGKLLHDKLDRLNDRCLCIICCTTSWILQPSVSRHFPAGIA